jgi:anaerobic selenocysteine-containing dehydrogenase
VRYTNAPWLIIEDPGAADHGLFVRDDKGNALAFDKRTGTLEPAEGPDIVPQLSGPVKLPDGRTAIPVFHKIAERYLSDEYSPERAEQECGVPAATTRRIADEVAKVAFEQTITLDIPWTDIHGRRHEKMVGRPVAMHAMRGISAHSNGFQTCRLIHILQILLGSIDCPGGFRYKPPYPKEIPPRIKPTGKPGQVKAGEPLPGPHLGFVLHPNDLLVDATGTPQRIDKAYSWDAPMAAHGLMHMVITNAANADPYPIDTLFMYMANMSWNSSMNIRDTLRYLTDKNPETGEYKIPRIIYSDAYYSEMVPYADLILPDTTYLERWDCISMLDRPISEPDAACDSIRHPIVEPDRNVRGFQSVLLDLGARLKLPGLVKEDGSPQFPGGYADYLVNHERAPGIGPLAGWRGNGDSFGKGAPNPDQLNRYIANGGFHAHHLTPSQRYFKHANKDYLDWAASVGFRAADAKMTFQLYCEPLQTFRLAAQGHGAVQPPETHRARIEKHFDPLPFWYPPFEGEIVDTSAFPMHALTQRPMHMYHSWGSQNAWLRQITGQNRLYMSRARGAALDIADDDWVWISSHLGRVRCQVRLMDGVNDHTAWTWNAIGKRSGAWGLSNDAPEATRGFLLNHLISELLPEKGGGYRYSNSDPITGQAAWYDLRVKIEKAAPEAVERSEPRFEPLDNPLGRAPMPTLSYGAEFKRARG